MRMLLFFVLFVVCVPFVVSESYFYAGGLQVAFKDSDGVVSFVHSDSLRSTVGVSGFDGVVGLFRSLPFGQPLVVGSRFVLTQKELDGSGLHYFGSRYYDSVVGRFLGRDVVLSNHPYAFVANNPLRFVDPTGDDVVDSRPPQGWEGDLFHYWYRDDGQTWIGKDYFLAEDLGPEVADHNTYNQFQIQFFFPDSGPTDFMNVEHVFQDGLGVTGEFPVRTYRRGSEYQRRIYHFWLKIIIPDSLEFRVRKRTVRYGPYNPSADEQPGKQCIGGECFPYTIKHIGGQTIREGPWRNWWWGERPDSVMGVPSARDVEYYLNDANQLAFRPRSDAVSDSVVSFSVNPNPVGSSGATIRSSQAGSMKVFDIRGRHLFSVEIFPGEQKWAPPNNLPSGVYAWQFENHAVGNMVIVK